MPTTPGAAVAVSATALRHRRAAQVGPAAAVAPTRPGTSRATHAARSWDRRGASTRARRRGHPLPVRARVWIRGRRAPAGARWARVAPADRAALGVPVVRLVLGALGVRVCKVGGARRARRHPAAVVVRRAPRVARDRADVALAPGRHRGRVDRRWRANNRWWAGARCAIPTSGPPTGAAEPGTGPGYGAGPWVTPSTSRR
jgi:hypothetical protein